MHRCLGRLQHTASDGTSAWVLSWSSSAIGRAQGPGRLGLGPGLCLLAHRQQSPALRRLRHAGRPARGY